MAAAAMLLALAGCAGSAPTPEQDVQPIAPVDIAIDEAANRLATAISFKTISAEEDKATRDAEFRKLDDLILASYPRVHAELQREVFNQFALLYTWRGTDPAAKPMLLMGHLDVVPVDPKTADQWEGDSFDDTVRDGIIWGRGALDDKLSVLGILEAVEHLLAQGFRPNRTVYLAFGHDEELDGELGAQAIVKELQGSGVRLDFVLDEGLVVADGLVPGVEKPVALIGTAEKGYLTLELTAEARDGHSSIPPKHTAIGRMARAINSLETNKMPADLRPPASEMFAAIAPDLPFMQRMAMSNLWLFRGMVISELEAQPETNATIRTTTAPTMVRGGIKENVLPSSATVTVNFRILPGDTIETVTDHVRTTVNDPEVEIAELPAASNPTRVSSGTSAAYDGLRRTILEIFPGVAVAPALVLAATDSRHYDGIAEDVYRFLPVRMDSDRLGSIHGVNEYLEVSAYADVIGFYIRLIENTAG